MRNTRRRREGEEVRKIWEQEKEQEEQENC
jgi:hypothetical protein